MTTTKCLSEVVGGIQGKLCHPRQQHRSAVIAELKQDEKEEPGAGHKCQTTSLSVSLLEPEPSNQARLTGQASLSRRHHPAHGRKQCLEPNKVKQNNNNNKNKPTKQTKKTPTTNQNPEEQHQNTNTSNQSGLVLPLQPGPIITAHPCRPHCPTAAIWFLLPKQTKSLDLESVRLCLEMG